MRILIASLVVGLAASPMAHAELRCLPADTVSECWNRYLESEADLAETELQNDSNEEEDSLADIETGLDTGSTDQASSVKNFLPLLRMTGLVGDGDDDTGDEVLTLDLNFLLGGSAQDRNMQFQAVIETNPGVFAPLQEAIPEGDRDTLLPQLRDGIGDLDDYSLEFTYNRLNDGYGRSFRQHRTRFERLFRAALASVQTDATRRQQTQSLILFTNYIQNGCTGPGAIADNVQFSSITNKPGCEKFQADFEAMAAREAEIEQDLRGRISGFGLRSFAELVNNQPQLHFSIKRNFRDDVTGPDETSVKVTYEMGFVNLNNFLEQEKGDCAVLDEKRFDSGDVSQRDSALKCGASLGKYVIDHQEELEQGSRLAFSLQYSETDSFSPAFSDSNFSFFSERSKSIKGSVSYGRLFQMRRDSSPTTRIDVSANYEDVSGDPNRNNRAVASLTVTKKLGEMSVPFTLVFANRGKYLPQSDEQLSAHVGIIFGAF